MLRELLPTLFLVPGEYKGRFPYSNGLLINSAELRVLVDTGFGQSRREEILKNGDVDVIVNTHYHLDHAFGNQFFPRAKVWVHHLDAPALRSAEVFANYIGLDHAPNFPESYPFWEGMPGRPVARELVDGESLDFGEITFQVIHTPGHTPGHISLFEPTERILFAGDIDLSPFGPFYGNRVSNVDEFHSSIRRLIELKPRVLLSSHSEIITDNIPERFRDYEKVMDFREEKIMRNLRRPMLEEELLAKKIIYDHYPEPQSLFRYFERVMIGKHLRRLLRLGKVVLMPDQKYKAYA